MHTIALSQSVEVKTVALTVSCSGVAVSVIATDYCPSSLMAQKHHQLEHSVEESSSNKVTAN